MTWGLYLHVPWCRRRCPYCAFYVEAAHDVPWDAFADVLLTEYATRKNSVSGLPHTVFFGGGTPSRMPTPVLSRVLAGIERAPGTEVTAECNPEDCTQEWLDGALEAGITRVSLGMQTFQPAFARLLNRACSVPEAKETAERVASSALTSWSVDLMFALPNQTLEQLDADLDAIQAIGAPHVSLYGLTYEPGTPFTRARDKGTFTETSDDLWRDMYDHIVERLRNMGLERYEVSNFAKPGHRSIHNQLYWSDRPYLGLGPSAHGYLPTGERYHNAPNIGHYLSVADPTELSESPNAEQAATDALVSGLRGVEGIDLAALAHRHGVGPQSTAVDRLEREGLIHRSNSRIALTDAGFPVCDAICGHLSDRLVPVG
ncbi:MAG: oxygen-independent coproporphyrinogen-3 oxidase [Myxococcota bacterium]|jgi:oxygen-independent coproporphyrinogen-3 oxidase